MIITNINDSNIKLPTGWSLVCLKDLCTQDRKIVEPNSKLALSLPYLSLEHIESNTGRILRHASELVVKDEGNSTTFAFDSRHVLYSKLRPYLNKVALPNFSGRCTTELIPFIPNDNVSRRYLAWLFRHPKTVANAMQEKLGSRMPRTNIKELLNISFPIPDLIEEQEKIADIMDKYINQIEKARNACLEQLALIDDLSKCLVRDFPLEIN